MRIYFEIRVLHAGERLMPDRHAIEREGRGMFVIRVLGFFLMIAWLVLYAINPIWIGLLTFPLPIWLRLLGFALGLASLGFWTWTQAVLGTEWSPQLQLREKHHLITTGPYNQIRHPIYTSLFVYTTSLAIVTANVVFAVLTLAVIAVFSIRVPKEEEMMIKEFGEEYKAYMQRTGMFFPKKAA